MNTKGILKLALIVGSLGFTQGGGVEAASGNKCLAMTQCATRELSAVVFVSQALNKPELIAELNNKWKPVIECCKENHNDWKSCNKAEWEQLVQSCEANK